MARYYSLWAAAILFMLSFETWAGPMENENSSGIPLRTLTFIVAEKNHHELLAGFREFADKNAFAIRVGETRPDGKHFLVQMWREDIKVNIVNPFDDPEEFRVAFYLNSRHPIPPVLTDNLATSLKDAISRIEGTEILEK